MERISPRNARALAIANFVCAHWFALSARLQMGYRISGAIPQAGI